LLRHEDVHTLFHEAGHAIHHLFSKCAEADVSGINGVEWDAVEFPSQFLENFSYEPAVLKMFARHYLTGEIISDELINKLTANKNFHAGLGLMRQLEFGIFDLRIHDKPYKIEEVREILRDTRKKTAVITPPEYVIFENGFSHIFGGGYAAGYYSYKWAEMLSADAYLAFAEKGVFDDEIAASYKENILERGGSAPMGELFKEFMGRAPKEEKLLELMGMKE
ncbi:MAG: M3 family peptidase, partial [Mucispirillum sp.]|nr:M3 family peptidase [Mucispirillum sp.]